jgi:hypothetical protein
VTRAARVSIAATVVVVTVIGGFVAWRLSVASSRITPPAAAPAEMAAPSAGEPIVPGPSAASPSTAAPPRESPAQPSAGGWFASAPPAPAPKARVLPFEAGEELQYQVLWSAGGMASLPAGDAVFRVGQGASRPGVAGPGFRFELTVTTASWISAFFEATDRFWSLTGPDLGPMTHVQELNEGRRHLTRTMTFDGERQRVMVGSGPPETITDPVEFPWVPGVRDPLGAFYQARLITIGPATRLSLPVNNVGHALTLVLSGAGMTDVAAEGLTQPALLLDARLDEAGIQEPHPTARVWLSTDHRRIPLAIDVTGSFGTVRVELKAYRRKAPAPGA